MISIMNKENREKIREDFKKFYRDNNYKILDPVSVNSKIDPTVFLVGSCTSVFKSIFLNKEVDSNGFIIAQPSVNSKFLENIYSDGKGRYGSYYVTLGVLDNYSNMERTLDLAYNYITNVLGFSPSNIKFIVNTKDYDFLEAISKINGMNSPIIEREISRNAFGKYKGDIIVGRTLRINYVNENNNSDSCIMNMSTYEHNDKTLGIEVSTSIDVLALEKMNYTTTIETSVLQDLNYTTDNTMLKLYECLSVIGTLMKDGVIPNSSKMDGRIFKRYNKALEYLLGKLGMDYDTAISLINYFIINEQNIDNKGSHERIKELILKR